MSIKIVSQGSSTITEVKHLSSNSFQTNKTFCGVVSAVVEQSRRGCSGRREIRPLRLTLKSAKCFDAHIWTTNNCGIAKIETTTKFSNAVFQLGWIAIANYRSQTIKLIFNSKNRPTLRSPLIFFVPSRGKSAWGVFFISRDDSKSVLTYKAINKL